MNARHLICLAALFAAVPAAFAQTGLPDNIKVPDGHKVAMETTGVGEITYECRDKANMAGQTEWVFVGPKAVLNDRAGKQVGTYFGPRRPGKRRMARKSPAPNWPSHRRARAICPINWSRPIRPRVKVR